MIIKTLNTLDVGQVDYKIKKVAEMFETVTNQYSVESKKTNSDLVTSVDKELEAVLIKELNECFPAERVLSEETNPDETLKDGEWTWVIDPIDGTVNFVHGYAKYCISVALCFGSEAIASWVYDMTRKDMYFAKKGIGTYYNGEKVSCSIEGHLHNSLVGCGFSNGEYAYHQDSINHMNHLISKCRSLRISGSSCLDLAFVATGQLDGFWHYDLKVWDVMAGGLLIKEAGGIVTDLHNHSTPSPVCVVAGNKSIHWQLLHELTSHGV